MKTRKHTVKAGLATKPTLIIFTNKYPLSDFAEAFLDAEIPYASKYFRRIVFCHFGNERDDIRAEALARIEVPVSVIAIPRVRGILALLKPLTPLLLCLSVRDILTEYSARVEKGRASKRRVSHLKESVYGVLRLQLQLRSLRESLGPLAGPGSVFYSYWFAEGAYLAASLARKSRGISVSRAHAFDIYDQVYGYRCYHRCTIGSVDAIFACSTDGMEHLKADLPWASAKIHTAFLGTPTPTVQDDDCGVPWSRSGLHVVSCADIVPAKRLDRLVRALSATNCGPIRWTHIGGSGVALANLRTCCERELRNRPYIRFELLGLLSNEEVHRYYEAHRVDLFVSTSDIEGLPVSMMEAMSYGIPVIGTDVGGVSEIVRNGHNGFLVSADDTAERRIAEIIEHVYLDGDGGLKALRANARDTWVERFQAERNYPEFYENLLSLAARAAPQADRNGRSSRRTHGSTT